MKQLSHSDRRVATAFVAPVLIFLGILTVAPVAISIWVSLRSWTLTIPGSNRFAGLQQYTRLFRDQRFLESLEATAFLTIIPIGFQMVLGCVLAFLLYFAGPKTRILRILMVLPTMIPPVVVGLIWKVLFMPGFSVVNYGLETVGLPSVSWFDTALAARVAITIAAVWQWTPFVMLIVLAGLDSVSTEVTESARVDGASALQMVGRILIPLVRPVLFVALLFRIVEALNVLPLIIIMTAGGPAAATETVNFMAFSVFTYFELSKAAAICVLIFLTLGSFGLYVVTVVQSDKPGRMEIR